MRLDQHLAAYPDALSSGDGRCPRGLVRLASALHGSGLDMIRPIACANCGQAGQALPRTSPSGRMCASCGDPDRPRGQCIQCGRSYRLHARWVTDGRCGRCVGIGRVMGNCAQCGRLARAYRRLDDGGALCQRCAPRRVHQCRICGSLAPAHTNRQDGPVCGRCYNRTTRPRRTCSRCGRERFIELSANAEHGDLCDSCYRGPVERAPPAHASGPAGGAMAGSSARAASRARNAHARFAPSSPRSMPSGRWARSAAPATTAPCAAPTGAPPAAR
jgi:hypothetical protein